MKYIVIEDDMVKEKIKICIVEDYNLTRTALKYSLSEFPDI